MRLGLLSAIVTAVLAVAATPAQQTRVTLKVRSASYSSWAPLYIAQADGFFAQEGLEIDQIEMSSGGTLVPALIRGDIDVLPMEVAPAIFNAIARGGRLRVVGSQIQGNSACLNSGLVTTKATLDSGILKDPMRLRGRKFSVGTNMLVRYVLDEALKPTSLTSDDLETVEVPESARIEALRTGRIDIARMGEPQLSRALAQPGLVLWKSESAFLSRFQYSVILFGPSLLDERSGVGERFFRAYLRGVQQFLQGKTPHNLDLLEAFLHFDRETLTKICWSPVNADARVNVDSLMTFQKWLIAKKAVDRALQPDEIMDMRFLDAATRARVQ
jgi:NitT/TauT family transport system substrate-binding protein